MNLICIVCPRGCTLEIDQTGDGIHVSGNLCPRGVVFAKNELTNPLRSLTTTVRTSLPGINVLPVRTTQDIPKSKIREAMEIINKLMITHPVKSGDVIYENLLGSESHVIVTRDS